MSSDPKLAAETHPEHLVSGIPGIQHDVSNPFYYVVRFKHTQNINWQKPSLKGWGWMDNSFCIHLAMYLFCNNQRVCKCESIRYWEGFNVWERTSCFGFLTRSVLSRVYHCKRWPTKIWQLSSESVFHSIQTLFISCTCSCPLSTSIRENLFHLPHLFMFWTGMCCCHMWRVNPSTGPRHRCGLRVVAGAIRRRDN